MWTNDQTPVPPPTTGSLRARISSAYSSRHRRARPVERAVAQHDALERGRLEHRALEVADPGHRLALLARRRRVERVALVLRWPSGPRVGPAREARGHDPPGARSRPPPPAGGRCPRCAAGSSGPSTGRSGAVRRRRRARSSGARRPPGRRARRPRPPSPPSSPSITTGSAPRAAIASRLPLEVTVPTTSWPRSTSWGISCRPIAPPAPATNTRMILPPGVSRVCGSETRQRAEL